MPGETYLFIDAGHLRPHYISAIQDWCGTDGEIDYAYMGLECNAQKCFYYDCRDTVKRDSETENDFNARVAKQDAELARIRRLSGTHVRLGTLTGAGKEKRQKQVDIMLAVDMMNHAARGNMATAHLITGDLDFKPLVQSLVDMGVFVKLHGDRKHTSSELADAADYYMPLSISRYVQWTAKHLRDRFPVPGASTYVKPEPSGYSLIRSGTVAGKPAELLRYQTTHIVQFADENNPGSFKGLTATDVDRLLLFCELEYGTVALKPAQ
jgi:uncharacterized LabA/DUF88 family protein